LRGDVKQQIISRYEDRLKRFGPSTEVLATGTEERQQIRYEVLAGVGDLQGCSVLDLGCGLGGFYGYLEEKGISVNYTGYDIVPGFIDVAKERYSEAHFEVRDIQDEGFGDVFDYIISSQVFNNKFTDSSNVEFVRDILGLCLQACRIGTALDLVSSHVDYYDDHLFYYPPEDMFAFCKSLTKRVVLRHDYPLFEFCLYLYKDFEGWRSG